MNNLNALSPLDGRYADKLVELSPYFSEMALLKYRVQVEVEYFIALSKESKVKELPAISAKEQVKLRAIYQNFSIRNAEKIKAVEKVTNHDVKAIEYFLKEKIKSLPCRKYAEFLHFALTSEDVNNLAYSLMLKEGAKDIIFPKLAEIVRKLSAMASAYKKLPLLSLTHGQPATPTTLGKELKVLQKRIERGLNHLKFIQLEGKLNGATGNYAAALAAYPKVDWLRFSKKFVRSLGLNPNLWTTQIEPHDSLSLFYDGLARVNNAVKNLDADMWLYISRGVFVLKKKAGEVGSSTMPHKVNPINFENSEGNLGLANAILRFMSDKLTVSRLQRDLTDSTVLRNQGSALGYSMLAYENTLHGLSRLSANAELMNCELEDHWEVLAEPIQVVLRRLGYAKPYEKLKELTRGECVDKKSIHTFIQSLDIPKKDKQMLLKLTPQNYTGLSSKLAQMSK